MVFSIISIQFREIDCQALYTFNQVLYIYALFLRSFAYTMKPVLRKFCHWSREHQSFPSNVRYLEKLRIYPFKNHYLSMAVWSRRWFIVVPLVLIILGHWSLLLHGMTRSLSNLFPFFHSKPFCDRRPFEGYLDTWPRLCHYRNG